MVRRAWHPPRVLAFSLVLLFLLGALAPFPGANVASGAGFQPLSHPIRIRGGARPQNTDRPPTYAECLAVGIVCYNPQEIHNAYNETPLLSAGDDGTGQTIVIVDSFGSPTLQHDLDKFDRAFGLPRVTVHVVAPLGTVQFDPSNPVEIGWAYETTLDVEWAHAIAPGANIVLLTSPVAETEGIAGMPQFYRVEKYALDNHLGQVMSQSWGATEETFRSAGLDIVSRFEGLYQQAASQGVTVFASAGDNGVVNASNPAGTRYFDFPTVIYPASSQWVTAAGGTTLSADANGNYQGEVTWNDFFSQPSHPPIATGGGLSHLFTEPSWQSTNLPSGTQTLLNGRRGIPDIAYDSDPYTGVLIYESFDPAGAGWLPIGGTSAASPQWAGLIAIADQIAGHPLGYLNPTLYALNLASSNADAVHDITVGNNTDEDPYDGQVVTGFSAAPGWDLVTGWGTPNAAVLIPLLAHQ